ncbi:hypothetical protein MG293_011262, partial [Ovis ammon polii]
NSFAPVTPMLSLHVSQRREEAPNRCQKCERQCHPDNLMQIAAVTAAQRTFSKHLERTGCLRPHLTESSAVYLHPLKVQRMEGFPGEGCPDTSEKQDNRQDSSREAHAKPLAMSLSRLLDAPATFVGPEDSADKAGEGEASHVPSQSEAVHSFCDTNVHQGFLALS